VIALFILAPDTDVPTQLNSTQAYRLLEINLIKTLANANGANAPGLQKELLFQIL